MVLDYSSFSYCGQYYGYCGSDGKLKIWETATGTLKQEYIPNLHLTSPCTCLTWIAPSSTTFAPPHKKKRKSDGGGGAGSAMVAMGTRSGGIVLYSIAEGKVIGTLQDGHKSAVSCLAWERDADLFTCAAELIVHWDVNKKLIRSKWKSGTETVTAMQVSVNGKSLLTASRDIKWWNVETRSLIRTFTGHASPVFSLNIVSLPSGDLYCVSAAQNDRLLNTWSLNSTSGDKNAVVTFGMNDLASSLTIKVTKQGLTNMVAVTKSGAMLFYSHQLNGKCGTPLKPKAIVMIASDAGQNRTKVSPIPIVAAQLNTKKKVKIVYGSIPFLAFETIELDSADKELCLVRKDPKLFSSLKQQDVTKVRGPEVGGDVEYLTPSSINGSIVGSKRGRGKESEVPMEERLENLALNQPSSSSAAIQPKSEGLAHLLIQGLQSKDKSLLQSVLFRKDEAVISQTIQRLPVQVISPLVRELTVLIQGKTYTSQIAAEWLRAVLSIHASQLLADSNVAPMLAPLLGLVESRLGLLGPLCRLRGRLDLLLNQVTGSDKQNLGDSGSQALLNYQDQDSSDEGSDIFVSDVEEDNESEEHWDELSDEEGTGESEDVEMSN